MYNELTNTLSITYYLNLGVAPKNSVDSLLQAFITAS